MSEEEEMAFNNDDDEEFQEPEEIDDQNQDDEPNPDDESIENRYQRAKGLIGFDDMEAVDIFYDIYCDQQATQKLQAKSLKHAAITLSSSDDYERILGSLTDVFNAYNDQIINDKLCSKIVTSMMFNIRDEQALTDFLNTAAESIDKNTQLPLFIDIKLKQAELSLKKADYDIAQNDLSDIEQFVGIPPDHNDMQMCKSAVRVLLLKIELAEVFSKDEDQIFEYYKTLKSVPNANLSQDRQNAVLKKIEGQMALHDRNFEDAKKLFHESFKLFDSCGSDKRLDCLPFLALSIMCMHDLNAIEFSDPQINPYINHPIVAPLKQLFDTFKDNKYAKFNDLLDSARKVFSQKIKNADFYFELLDDVRLFVLHNNIKAYCPTYKRLELHFLADDLKCQIDEAQRLIFDLIHSRELYAVFDTELDMIIMQKVKERSPYLQNVQTMLDSLAIKVREQTKKSKFD